MTGLGVTLIVALAVALVLGALAQRLRLAPLVGFIAAGLVVGPFTPGFVADREQVFDLADIGVALLMFSMGLRFPLHRILEVGRPVFVGALLQVSIVMGLGFAAGIALGLDWLEALFVGAVVSNSSSVVVVKVSGDQAVEGTVHGRIALAWSTIQDVTTVALVVLLSSLALGQDDFFVEVGGTTLAALAFIVAVVFGGSRLFPMILGRLAAVGSREIFIIGVAVIAIGTSFAAGLVGISVALGAFVTGIALADSDLTDSVLGEIVPLRELFAAFFFVSIGLLVDPGAVLEGVGLVLVVLALIIPVKAAITAALSRLVGHAPAVALRVAGMLAQNGEFSFVLAVVGLELGVVSDATFSHLMGAAVASIIGSPLVVRVADAGARRMGERSSHRAFAEREPSAARRRHAVILGYGRVGRSVARALRNRDFPFVVVEADYAVASRGREEGASMLYGEGGSRTLLDAAGIDEAILLVAAIPDALATRQAVDYAVQRNPRIEVVARAHSEAEERHLRGRGVRRVVVAEREVANELVHHALRRFGVSDREIAPMLARAREG